MRPRPPWPAWWWAPLPAPSRWFVPMVTVGMLIILSGLFGFWLGSKQQVGETTRTFSNSVLEHRITTLEQRVKALEQRQSIP